MPFIGGRNVVSQRIRHEGKLDNQIDFDDVISYEIIEKIIGQPLRLVETVVTPV